MLGLIAAMVMAGAEPAMPPPPKPALDMMRYYPDRAARLGIEGSATLRCMVTDQGLLTDCVVAAEEPADAGFGDAALKMSRLFKMKSAMRDGTPVGGGPVTIPLRFQLPKEPETSAPK